MQPISHQFTAWTDAQVLNYFQSSQCSTRTIEMKPSLQSTFLKGLWGWSKRKVLCLPSAWLFSTNRPIPCSFLKFANILKSFRNSTCKKRRIASMQYAWRFDQKAKQLCLKMLNCILCTVQLWMYSVYPTTLLACICQADEFIIICILVWSALLLSFNKSWTISTENMEVPDFQVKLLSEATNKETFLPLRWRLRRPTMCR